MARDRIWLFMGALLGGLAVAFGAFGAHGLDHHLAKSGISASEQVHLLDVWETAARYQMYHALALLAVGLLAARRCSWCIHLAGTALTLGTLIFSGCLYALVLTGERYFGAIVPAGGTLMIVGWACLTISVCRLPAADDSACRVE